MNLEKFKFQSVIGQTITFLNNLFGTEEYFLLLMIPRCKCGGLGRQIIYRLCSYNVLSHKSAKTPHFQKIEQR